MKTTTIMFFVAMYTLVTALTAIAFASGVYELLIFALIIFAIAENDRRYYKKNGDE